MQFQEISILPHKRDRNFLEVGGGGGGKKQKKLKKNKEVLLKFTKGKG